MREENEKEGEKYEKRETCMGERKRFRVKKKQMKAGRVSEEKEDVKRE